MQKSTKAGTVAECLAITSQLSKIIKKSNTIGMWFKW